MLKSFLLFTLILLGNSTKSINEQNKNWLTVGKQTGAVLLQNLPTHYPEWKPTTLVVEQSKHGRSPIAAKHAAYLQAKPYRPRLRNRKHQ